MLDGWHYDDIITFITPLLNSFAIYEVLCDLCAEIIFFLRLYELVLVQRQLSKLSYIQITLGMQ